MSAAMRAIVLMAVLLPSLRSHGRYNKIYTGWQSRISAFRHGNLPEGGPLRQVMRTNGSGLRALEGQMDPVDEQGQHEKQGHHTQCKREFFPRQAPLGPRSKQHGDHLLCKGCASKSLRHRVLVVLKYMLMRRRLLCQGNIYEIQLVVMKGPISSCKPPHKAVLWSNFWSLCLIRYIIYLKKT